MSSGSPLGQLADLLRRVEAKTRAQELTDELSAAAEQLRLAEEAIREIESRSRNNRPARQRELDLIEGEEQLLRDLTRKTAQNRTLMGEEEFVQAERLIETSRGEIQRRRLEATRELQEIDEALDRARIEVRAALDRYHHVRRELDRLQVSGAGGVEEGDRLAQVAEEYFPEFQVRAFVREVEDNARKFGTLERREQYAQMRIWIGRLRRFQFAGPAEDERDLLESVFRRLVGLSKQFEPGYIEAFNRQYTADWDAYIAEAQESLRLASEDAQRGRERAGDRAEPAKVDPESARFAAQALEQLRALLLTHYDDPDAKAARVRESLSRILESGGPPDPALLELIRPYRGWLTGPEFRTLRAQLHRESADEPTQGDPPSSS